MHEKIVSFIFQKIVSFISGSKSVLAYATVHGNIIGWDMRMPELAWNLKNDYKAGKYLEINIFLNY